MSAFRSSRTWDDASFFASCEAALPAGSALRASIEAATFERYESCYDARAIAPLLAGLASDDEWTRVRALLRLGDEIEHQGSTYASTKPVVEFLVRAIEAGFYANEAPAIFAEQLRLPNVWRHVPDRTRRVHEPPRVLLERTLHPNGQPAKRGSVIVGPTRLEHGTWASWNTAGQLLGTYEMDEGSGIERSWHESGGLAEEVPRVAGRAHGLWRSFDERGVLRSAGAFKAGKRDGETRTYHPTGALKFEGMYVADLEEGPHREFDPAGALLVETHFQRGKKHGVSTEWRAGMKRSEVSYRRGRRHGPSTTYDQQGNPERTVQWDEGKPRPGPR